MRFLVASIAVHAVVVWWLAAGRVERVESQTRIRPTSSATQRTNNVEAIEIEVEMLGGASAAGGGSPAASGGSPRTSSARAATAARRASAQDAWDELTIRDERHGNAGGTATSGGSGIGNGRGNGIGNGRGNGIGNGIGFGTGGGIRVERGEPLPPVPVPVVSKARPATLIWPTRDREVEDDADLFIARVTVDENGDVVGARMVKTRPGSTGEHAANAIWQFRYLPALDERGVPTRSTFEQPFQIR